MPAVFIAQSTLDEWSDQGKVRLEGTVLTLLDEDRTVSLRPAVRFTKVVDGSPDPHGLLGKVKTKVQLDELGAEHYLDSVLLGETAYEVVEGFLGDLARPPRKAAAPAVGPEARAAPDAVTLPPPSAAPPVEAASAPAAAPEDAPSSETDEARALSELFLNTVR